MSAPGCARVAISIAEPVCDGSDSASHTRPRLLSNPAVRAADSWSRMTCSASDDAASAFSSAELQKVVPSNCGQRAGLNGCDTASAMLAVRTTRSPRRLHAASSDMIGEAGDDQAEFASASNRAATLGTFSIAAAIWR